MSDPGCQLAEEMRAPAAVLEAPGQTHFCPSGRAGGLLAPPPRDRQRGGAAPLPPQAQGMPRTLRGDPPASQGISGDPGPLATTVGGCISSGQDPDC